MMHLKRNFSQRSMPYRSANSKNIHGKPNYDNLEDQVRKSSVLLIRHARSVQNDQYEKLTEHNRDSLTVGDYIEALMNKKDIDTPLSSKGFEQCKVASEHAKKINFKTVWISPLRRTLHTAAMIFQDHPNF